MWVEPGHMFVWGVCRVVLGLYAYPHLENVDGDNKCQEAPGQERTRSVVGQAVYDTGSLLMPGLLWWLHLFWGLRRQASPDIHLITHTWRSCA